MVLDGSLNIFEYINRYIELRKKLVMSEANKKGFFRLQILDRQSSITFLKHKRSEKTN